jgi:hypothetical protein
VTQYSTAYVSTNGFLSFTDQVPAPNRSWFPSTAVPNAAVYGTWTDLVVDSSASVRTATAGTGADRRFVVEWRNVMAKTGTARGTFAITLYESGQVVLNWQVAPGYDQNAGLEDATGARYFQYVDGFSGSRPASGHQVRFLPP